MKDIFFVVKFKIMSFENSKFAKNNMLMKILSKTTLFLFLFSVLLLGCKKDELTLAETQDFQFSVDSDQLTRSNFKAIIVSNFDGRVIYEKIITDADRADGLNITFKKAENDIVCVSFLEDKEDSKYFSGSTYFNIENGTSFDYIPNPEDIRATVRLEIDGLNESSTYEYQLGNTDSDYLNPIWENSILQLNTALYKKADEIFFTIKDSLSDEYRYFLTKNIDTLYKINYQNLPTLTNNNISKIGINLPSNFSSDIDIRGFQNQTNTSVPLTSQRTIEGDTFLIFSPPNLVFDEYLISANTNSNWNPSSVQIFDKKYNSIPSFLDLRCDMNVSRPALPFYKFEDPFMDTPRYFAVEKIKVFGSYAWNISGFYLNDFQFQIPRVSDEIIAIAPNFEALERNANTSADQLSNLTLQYQYNDQQLEELRQNPLLNHNKEWYLKDGKIICIQID